jgi:hypothetical protein
MIVDFPPPDGTIIEETDRRIVQLRKTATGVSIDVWLRQVVDVRPTKLGGWYCSPDAGVSLTSDGANRLRAALEAP